MIFGSTQVLAKFSDRKDAPWQSISVSDLLRKYNAERSGIQVMSYSGTEFVGSDPGMFRICGYSRRAIKIEVPRVASLEGALVYSSIVSYGTSVSVKRKPSADCIPDACRLMWKPAISLDELYRKGAELNLAGKVAERKDLQVLPSPKFSSGEGSRDHPIYQIRTEVYGNVVLASGLIVHCL